eukprot:gene22972-30161_t
MLLRSWKGLVPSTLALLMRRCTEVYQPTCDTCNRNLSTPVQTWAANMMSDPFRLPKPLIPDNWENSDGFCVSGEELKQIYLSSIGTFALINEANPEVLGFDSTLGGHVKKSDTLTVKEIIHDNDGELLNITEGLTEILIGYLRTYEFIGKAEVTVMEQSDTESHRFKITGLVVSARPFHFATVHAAGLMDSIG